MEKLKTLFDKAKIKYVISVDDCYLSNAPSEADIKVFFVKNKDTAIAFCNEVGLENFEEIVAGLDEDYEDYSESFFDTLTPEQLEFFKSKYYVNQSEEKNSLESFFEELKKVNAITDFRKISSVSEANKVYDSIDGEYEINSENRILWMIDKDFAKSKGASDSGLKLISNFIANKKTNHVYALTSAQIGDIDNKKFREILNSDNPESSLNLLACVIHKHNIIEKSYGELFEQMYLGFRENYSGEIINFLKNNLNEACTDAGETIDLLSDEAIHNVIILGSQKEGISPIDTLQRLMMIILRDDLLKKLCESYDNIAKLVYDYAELCSWCAIDKRDPEDFERVVSIRKKECYDQNINKRYSPVSYGDIFEINKRSYILISQSCNLVVREDGQRNAQCATLSEIGYEKISDDSCYELSHYDTKKKAYVYFNKTINIDFSVLDLCSLNNKGLLEMRNDFDFSSVCHRYTSGMTVALKEVISQNKKTIARYERISNNKNELSVDEILSEVRSIYRDNATDLLATFGDGIKYNGRRVCRLCSDITEALCKRYFEYHSRKGLDFDFSSDYTIHEYDIVFNFNFNRINIDENQLMYDKKFKYYYVGEKDGKSTSDIKGKTAEAFKTFYRDKFLAGGDGQLKENPRIDTKLRTITINAIDIPVMINECLVNNVLNVKDNCITLRIPIMNFEMSKIKNKASNTYTDNTNNSKMIISSKCISFTFEKDFIFENNEIIEGKVTFNFEQGEHIKLSIKY